MQAWQGMIPWGAPFSGMTNQQQGNGSDDEDDPKYEPSATLRELITERLEEQRDCLMDIINKHIDPVVAESEAASQQAAAGGKRKKTPGDQYIDAQTVAMVTRGNPVAGRGPHRPYEMLLSSVGAGGRGLMGSLGTMGGRGRKRSNRPDVWSDPRSSMTPPSSSLQWWPSPTHGSGSGSGSGSDQKLTDPLQRYLQLAGEIEALVGLSGLQPQHESNDPNQASAEFRGLMMNPTEAVYKRLSKIVGTGGGGG